MSTTSGPGGAPAHAAAAPASASDATRRSTRLRPTELTVLYDAHCPVCRRARRWVERHRQLVPVRFVPAGSAAASRRFPQLDVGSTLAEVTVVTDAGAVLRGERAWIAVLWAVERTRGTAVRLAYGRRGWMLRGVKGATDTVRRLAAGQPDPSQLAAERDGWPPPTPPGSAPCPHCRT